MFDSNPCCRLYPIYLLILHIFDLQVTCVDINEILLDRWDIYKNI